MASGSGQARPPREMPSWVVRYEPGTVRAPLAYHSTHAHAEKLGVVLYENQISKEMMRRQVIIMDMQDAADAMEAAGKRDAAGQHTVEGETLEQHQKALRELVEDGERASAAFCELTQRVLRDEREKRTRTKLASMRLDLL